MASSLGQALRQQYNQHGGSAGQLRGWPGPLVFGDLYRLWGGDAPLDASGGIALDRLDIFRCIYPVCQPGYSDGAIPGLDDGLPSHTLVEVMHRSEARYFRQQRGSGMWFYLAVGSGVYLDLGKTKVFADHRDAASLWCPNEWGDPGMSFCLTREGGARGYDTLQFTRRNEDIWKYEILETHVLDPLGACPDAPNAHRYTSGWDGGRPCRCDPSRPEINCDFW